MDDLLSYYVYQLKKDSKESNLYKYFTKKIDKVN
jgi:hypothetical protein